MLPPVDPRVSDDSSSVREAGLGAKMNYGVGVVVLVVALAAVLVIMGFLSR